MPDHPYHDFSDPEADSIVVQTPDDRRPGEWLDCTRVAEHGAAKLMRDGAVPPMVSNKSRTTFRLIWDWGNRRARTVVVRDGQVVSDTSAA